MALACGKVPHFTTIAAFISGHAEQVEAIFEQVLLICDLDGLLGKELFAIDGCKMSSNAAKEWSAPLKNYAKSALKLEDKSNTVFKNTNRRTRAVVMAKNAQVGFCKSGNAG